MSQDLKNTKRRGILNVPPSIRAAANRRAHQPFGISSGCNWGRSSNAGVTVSPDLMPRSAPKCGRCNGGNCGASSNAGVTVSPELMPRVAASGGHSSGGSSGASSNAGVEVYPDRMHRVARSAGRCGFCMNCSGALDASLNRDGRFIAQRSGTCSRCEACSTTGGICSHSNLANQNFGGYFPFLRSCPKDIL